MRKRASLAVAAAGALAAGLLVSGSTPAQADPVGDLVGTVSVPSRIAATTTDTATIAVYQQQDASIPATATMAAPNTIAAQVGSLFTFDVPGAWFYRGWANVTVTARLDNQWTLWNLPVQQGKPAKFTIGSNPNLWITAPSEEAASRQITALADPSAIAAAGDPACVYHQDSQDATRIGEMHLAKLDGMTSRFVYSVEADSDISTGFHVTGKNWEISGSKHVSERMAAEGGVKFHGVGARRYVNSHFIYRLRWVPQFTCDENQWMYSTFEYDSVGDAFRGPNRPGGNPTGQCHGRPWYGKVEPDGGTYSKTRGEGTSYGQMADLFGFSYSGHTGWTTHVRLNYHNSNQHKASYVCGDASQPKYAHTIYNNTW